MRSWSIPIGRLFGVDIRIHLTFFILPVFILWGDYLANKDNATGPRDLAIVAIILACVAAHECGHMLAARRFGLVPKAVILLPLTGVALYDEPRTEKPLPAAVVWKRELRLALIGPLVSLVLASLAASFVAASGRGAELWKWPFLQASNLPKSLVWANLYLAAIQPHARLSARWRTHPARIPLPHTRCFDRDATRRLHQQCHRHGPDAGRPVQR